MPCVEDPLLTPSIIGSYTQKRSQELLCPVSRSNVTGIEVPEQMLETWRMGVTFWENQMLSKSSSRGGAKLQRCARRSATCSLTCRCAGWAANQ